MGALKIFRSPWQRKQEKLTLLQTTAEDGTFSDHWRIQRIRGVINDVLLQILIDIDILTLSDIRAALLSETSLRKTAL